MHAGTPVFIHWACPAVFILLAFYGIKSIEGMLHFGP